MPSRGRKSVWFVCKCMFCSGICAYNFSNVTVVDEKVTYFHQYPRFCHRSGTTVFSIPSAIICAYYHFASAISHRVGLFEPAVQVI